MMCVHRRVAKPGRTRDFLTTPRQKHGRAGSAPLLLHQPAPVAAPSTAAPAPPRLKRRSTGPISAAPTQSRSRYRAAYYQAGTGPPMAPKHRPTNESVAVRLRHRLIGGSCVEAHRQEPAATSADDGRRAGARQPVELEVCFLFYLMRYHQAHTSRRQEDNAGECVGAIVYEAQLCPNCRRRLRGRLQRRARRPSHRPRRPGGPFHDRRRRPPQAARARV